MEQPTAPCTQVWLAASPAKSLRVPQHENCQCELWCLQCLWNWFTAPGVLHAVMSRWDGAVCTCTGGHGVQYLLVSLGSMPRGGSMKKWYSWAFLAIGHQLRSLKLSRHWHMCTAASPLGEVRCPRATCWACTDHRWERVKTLELWSPLDGVSQVTGSVLQTASVCLCVFPVVPQGRNPAFIVFIPSHKTIVIVDFWLTWIFWCIHCIAQQDLLKCLSLGWARRSGKLWKQHTGLLIECTSLEQVSLQKS